ncbi:MAG: Gfo/Idh/MocA family oxidoreductase [Eubacteriales bacterium]
MVRFATIGSNVIVDQFLNEAKKVEGLQYVSAYSRTPEKAKDFAKKHNALRWDSDLLELANAPDIDAVYIASPNSLHCEQAILMMKHNKHILCEKTIASNENELQEMLKVAQEHQVILLEAVRSAFDPGFETVAQNLGKLGKIRRATFIKCQYSSRYDKFRNGIIENTFDPSLSNGSLMDIGIYCIHPMVFLFGMPNRIVSDTIILENGVDGAGTILFSYDSMQAEMIYSKISNNFLPSQIQGEEGTMIIDEIADTRKIEILYRNGEKESYSFEKAQYNLLYEAQKWVEMIENQEKATKYNDASVMTLQVMDTVRKQLGIVFPADKKEAWK